MKDWDEFPDDKEAEELEAAIKEAEDESHSSDCGLWGGELCNCAARRRHE